MVFVIKGVILLERDSVICTCGRDWFISRAPLPLSEGVQEEGTTSDTEARTQETGVLIFQGGMVISFLVVRFISHGSDPGVSISSWTPPHPCLYIKG